MEALTFVKLLTTLGMFVIGLFPALLPMLVPLCCQPRTREGTKPKSGRPHHAMQLSSRGKKFVSALACFGAGVFIATFFLDMIGEVRKAFDEWYGSMHGNAKHPDIEAIRPQYPWPEFCAIMGFLMVLLMEQVVMYFHSRRHVHVSHNLSKRVQAAGGDRSAGTISEKDLLVEIRPIANGGTSENGISGAVVRRSNEPLIIMPMLGDTSFEKVNTALPLTHMDAAVPKNSNDFAQQQSSEVFISVRDAKPHTDLKSVMRAIILLLALCFHSIFEGVAIGLTTDQQNALTLFAGVCMHKGIEAFCLGLNISQSGIRPFLVVLFDVLFALMSPLGIVIGLAITDLPKTPLRYAVTAILQGLASGTFLYCTFIEILPKELLKDEMVAHDHDHSNVFLEDIAQNSTTIDDDLTHEDGKPATAHVHTSSHNSSEQADKLIKCLVFTVGIAVMAIAVAIGEHFGGAD